MSLEFTPSCNSANGASPPSQAARFGISAKALMAKDFAPIKYVVPGFIVEGLTFLAGAPKVGKSWLALDMCVAVAGGTRAMGEIECEAGDVLYLALEDNERRLKARLTQMLNSEPPESLMLCTEWPTLEDGGIAKIEEWVEASRSPRLVAIDVFRKMRGMRTSNDAQYDMDYRDVARLQEVALRHNIAILLVHHTRKQDADDPFDTMSGTRGLTGAADSILILARVGGRRRPVLYGRGRDLPEMQVEVDFCDVNGRWRIVGDATQTPKTPEREQILAVLKQSAQPMKVIEIASKVGKTRENVGKLTKKLVEEALVKPMGRGFYSPVCASVDLPLCPPAASVTLVTKVPALNSDELDSTVRRAGTVESNVTDLIDDLECGDKTKATDVTNGTAETGVTDGTDPTNTPKAPSEFEVSPLLL